MIRFAFQGFKLLEYGPPSFLKEKKKNLNLIVNIQWA